MEEINKIKSKDSNLLEDAINIFSISLPVTLGFLLSLTPYFINHHKNSKINVLEDKTAIASVGVVRNSSGEGIDGYVALDKTGDGKIDEIKKYSSISVGMRAPYPLSYTKRYNEGDKEFERLKNGYFIRYK